MNKEMRRKW